MKNLRSENRTKTHKPVFKMNAKNLSNLPISKDSNLNPQNFSPSKKLSHAPQEPTNIQLKSSSSEKRLSSNLNTYVPENKERNKNIRVYVRFRPFNIIETELLSTGVGWETPEYNENEIVKIKTNKNNNDNNGPAFKFDKVFNSNTPQVEIYNYVGKEIVKDVMDGYNGTIFAYGQSGSGKTFTMYGKDIDDEESKGLIPRIVSEIFDYVETCDENTNFQFKLSVLQIYKEVIYDLLTGEKNLQIKENPARGIYVDGLSEVYLSSVDDFLNYAELAEKNRKVGETRLNQQSSRSHSIMILEVSQQLKKENLIKKGILNLVDLAGSEKVSKTGAVGETLEEAKKINLSLSALGNVIHALTSNSEHIPYRDSKLTRILQESLGGNYKTSLIVACSPHSYNVDETVSSLQFAQRAKTIKNKVKVNIKYTYEELQQMVYKLNKKLEIANLKISKLQKGEKVEVEGNYDNCPNCEGLKEEKKNLEERVEELMNEIKEKNDRINELEEEEDSSDSDDDGVKNKIYKLYKQIKSELDVIKEHNSNFENDKIKENIIIQNENLDNLISNYMKNSDKNEFFNEINSLTKKGININREEKYEEIYNEYKKNLEEIFENKIYKENDISDIDKLNLFSIGYFYEYLHYYFSYQLLNDGYEKMKIDNNTLLNMTKSLLSLVDNILSTNYEIANDKALNANAINFLKSTFFDNNNMNFGQTVNQETNNQLMNLPKMNKRMSVTFGGDLKNLVKIVSKKNMNIMKNAGRRCSMIITEAPIEHVSNSTSNFVPSYRRTSVSIPLIFPKSFNNTMNINKNKNNSNDNKDNKNNEIDEISEIKEYSENDENSSFKKIEDDEKDKNENKKNEKDKNENEKNENEKNEKDKIEDKNNKINENEKNKIENENKKNENEKNKIEKENNKNENENNKNENENNKNENENNKNENENENNKNEESLQKVQKVFNSTEKKQSKLNMIKDLLIANVTKTEVLKKYFKEQKEDFDKIIKLNKDYFTNMILKKQGISNDNEIKNDDEKKINSENSEDIKLNEKAQTLTNNNNNSNNNIIEKNDNINKNTTQENDINNKEINNENINNEIIDENNDNKDINNNENKNEIKEENKKLKSSKNNFLKSSPKKEIKNTNNEIPYSKKDNEIIKLKSNNIKIEKKENDLFEKKISNKISNNNTEEKNNISIKSNISRKNTDQNMKKPSSSTIQISRKNSNKNSFKKTSKKNLKLKEEILNSNTTRNIFLHNKSNSDYLNINKDKKERRVFSLENYIEKYLETGTVTRKFDGIKVNLDHGKIKCIYAGGLNAHHKLTGNPLQNQRLKESKGDDDSVQSSLGGE